MYISHYFKRHREAYYDHLQRVRDEGDWEGWLQFFLRGVFEVSQEATATARAIVALRETHREQIVRQLGRSSGKALQLHEFLFERPILSVEMAQEAIDSSYSQTNQLINRMTSIGLMREITGQRRNRRFSYDTYLSLFADA